MRGRLMHEAYLRHGKSSVADRRCFIATSVFGDDAPETATLRRYRDVVLMRSRWGMCLVDLYYCLRPCLCRVLDHSVATASTHG
ncbi:CFI-box-CTERM domain-containing protein [Thauera sp. Sel9]|uniref:CFI-box-CTERM domain-containing protein n=1 Tax=Thauera sp. Sel9 TaxID=2974299 RepID=UPI002E104609